MKLSPINVIVLATVALVRLVEPSLSKADDIVRYRVVVLGTIPHFGEFKGEVGVYDTSDEAYKVMLDWDKSHPYDLDRTATVEPQVNKTLRKVIGVGKLIGDARR